MTRKIALFDKLDKQPNGCWLWTGTLTHDGYPRAGARYMHRVSYEMHKGSIAEGMTLDHLCKIRKCCNPDHLEPVTLQENISRGNYGWRSALTHCKRGHEFTPENTILRATGGRNGGARRDCRECGRIAQRAYQQKKRA
jgi:hypothetical protein